MKAAILALRTDAFDGVQVIPFAVTPFLRSVAMSLSGPTPLRAIALSVALNVTLCGALSTAATAQSQAADAVVPPSGFTPGHSFEEAMVVAYPDGDVWVRTKTFRASFTEDGFTAYPVFGRRSPQEWPVQFDTRSVQLNGAAMEVSNTSRPARDGQTVTVDRGAMREVYHLGGEQIEQTFVFDSLPAVDAGTGEVDGDLVVEIAVETELDVVVDGDVLHFAHEEFGHVSYGTAVVFDAKGNTRAIDRTWTDGGITLTVPRAFLETATLPLTIDPVVSSFVNGFGLPDDDNSPDVCFAGVGDRFYMCWQEFTSGANADVYCASYSPSGGSQFSFAVEITNDYWAAPRIASVNSFGRLLVVASKTTNGPGSAFSAIHGQLIDSNTNSTFGAPIFITAAGAPRIQPDVGGSNFVSTSNNHFLVTWSRVVASGKWNLQYRVIDWTGAFVTPVIDLVDEVGVTAKQAAVSETHGDASTGDRVWTITWIRDEDDDQLGQVWASRIRWNGTLQGAGPFMVQSSHNCKTPTVTSRFDDIPVGLADRPSVVAWARERPLVGGPQSDIEACVITDGASYQTTRINFVSEDFSSGLDQIRPSIATDGRQFFLGYSEEAWAAPNTIDYDAYMVSGNITSQGFGVELALSERHQLLENTTQSDVNLRIATVRDGDNQSFSSRSMCVFSSKAGPDVEYGRTRGAILIGLLSPAGNDRAVGVQYCDSTPNSRGLATDLRSGSWLSVVGTQSISNLHTVHCVDLPVHQFALLISATDFGNTLFPGGSSGRLCLGGNLGRYNNQVASSGPNGVFSATVDPSAIVQPNSLVSALPGETWYFQVWHRDFDPNGDQTSNFSNACSVTFLL